MPRIAGDDGALLYELARIHCFALNSARQDDRLTTTARREVAEQYARQAAALLTKAQAAGFFRDLGRAELLQKGPDLEPLRGREDFRQLLR